MEIINSKELSAVISDLSFHSVYFFSFCSCHLLLLLFTWWCQDDIF